MGREWGGKLRWMGEEIVTFLAVWATVLYREMSLVCDSVDGSLNMVTRITFEAMVTMM